MMGSISGNCLIAQSGGPTAVINASAYAVIKEISGLQLCSKIYLGLYGIKGILEKKIINISNIGTDIIETLPFIPSAALGSCRHKLKDFDEDESDYEQLHSLFREFEIRYFFYIGGNDSMDTANKINRYFQSRHYDLQVIGIPKTIDNDLVVTDHCPGYGSTAKYLSNVALEVWLDINTYEYGTIAIVEAMGRDTGWLANSTSILKEYVPQINQLIYVPEVPFDKKQFLRDIENAYQKSNKILIVASEGLKDKNGATVRNESDEVDEYGHAQLGGVGDYLKSLLRSSVIKRVKYIELGLSQRCAMHCASKTDIDEAMLVGSDAVKYASKGYSGYMVALKRQGGDDYKCVTELAALDKVCNQVKFIPQEWLGESPNREFLNYIKPLIIGEYSCFNENGLIKYSQISKNAE